MTFKISRSAEKEQESFINECVTSLNGKTFSNNKDFLTALSVMLNNAYYKGYVKREKEVREIMDKLV